MSSMNLANIRKLRGLTQIDLAEMIDVTQPTISRAERGDDGTTLGTYRACAEVLGVTLSDLFADDRRDIEVKLLDFFRKLPPDRQQGWVDIARATLGDL